MLQVIQTMILEVLGLHENLLQGVKVEKHKVLINSKLGCLASNILMIEGLRNKITEEITSELTNALAQATEREVQI